MSPFPRTPSPGGGGQAHMIPSQLSPQDRQARLRAGGIPLRRRHLSPEAIAK